MHNHPSNITDHSNDGDLDEQSKRLMRTASYASVGVAIILIVIKLYAWVMTGSVSIMSSLVDSMLDMIISIINLVAIRYSLMPADEDHRFGHTSAEDVAAMAQAAFIAGSALFITFTAVERFINPASVESTGIGIAVMAISIMFTFCLVIFQKYVVKKTGSTAIAADSLHYVGDLLMNVAVIAAIILVTQFDWKLADPILALLIAIYILYGSWKIGRLAFDKLMDKELPEEEQKRIIDFVLAYPGALGMHELKTRYSGVKPFIQFHLDLDGSQTLHDAHHITDAIEKKLLEMYPGGEVVIHQDPVNVKSD